MNGRFGEMRAVPAVQGVLCGACLGTRATEGVPSRQQCSASLVWFGFSQNHASGQGLGKYLHRIGSLKGSLILDSSPKVIRPLPSQKVDQS